MVKINSINGAPSRLCSIDASTNSLAFAIFDNNDLESFGKINFKGKNTYEKIADAAEKSLAFFNYYGVPECIVIEHTVFMNSPKTVADLALVQGAMLGSMSMSGAKTIKSINPIAWQTFIGNGRLTTPEKLAVRKEYPGKSDSWYKTREREVRKQKTIRFVSVQYGRTTQDNDVADAIGIGHYAISNWDKLSS
jgi:Holliday junction resolvasome RuvABC endonuclease subunit